MGIVARRATLVVDRRMMVGGLFVRLGLFLVAGSTEIRLLPRNERGQGRSVGRMADRAGIFPEQGSMRRTQFEVFFHTGMAGEAKAGLLLNQGW